MPESLLAIRFYTDAALTHPLARLQLAGQEGRFVDNHLTLYLGSPDDTKKWVSANGNSEITLYGSFDWEKWAQDYGGASPPNIYSANILLALDADYQADDESSFSSNINLPGEILGGAGNAIPIHVAMNSYSAGDLDYFRIYTDLLEELPV